MLHASTLARSLVSSFLLLAAVPVSARQVGSTVDDVRIGLGTPGFPPTVTSSGSFGQAADSFGDRDGDGVLDVAVGASNQDGEGAVYILSILPDGSISNSVEIGSAGVGGFDRVLDTNDAFGISVAVLGDVDGDGIEDLGVGAWGIDGVGGKLGVGAVFVLFLEASGQVRDHQEISEVVGGLNGPFDSYSRIGSSVESLGDLDGDGVPDLAVGAVGLRDTDDGGVLLLFLNADGTVKSQRTLDDNTPEFGGLVHNLSNALGRSLESLGDVDGDGLVDLAIGANYDGTTGVRNGAVIVTGLQADGTPVNPWRLDPPSGFGDADYRQFGTAITALGDLAGDGGTVFAVSESGDYDGNLAQTKAVWVFALDAQGTLGSSHVIDPLIGSVTDPVDIEARFGVGLAGIGDWDGDGVGDLLVGASNDSLTGNYYGALYLLSLSNGKVVSSFTPDSVQGSCSVASADFVDTSTGDGLFLWEWDFGDGTTSTEQNPSHDFLGSATRDVSLRVTGSEGTGRLIRKGLVVIGPPVVDFEASATLGNAPLAVDFSDTSSPGVSDWSWDFGDGAFSSLQHPSHTYAAPGTYTVTLTIDCDGSSASETKVDFVTVFDDVAASATVANGSGVNPLVLTSVVDPVVGTTWMGQVDGGSVGAAGLVFFVGYLAPLEPGIRTGIGELLVDPTSAFVVQDFGFLLGGIATIDLPIPNDPAFVGFTYAGQALLTNVGGGQLLTNRLDFSLGF